jgi:tetrapyrrole methylase family protein/MazG family protein
MLEGAAQHDISVRIVAGVSFLEPTLTALKLDALNGLQIVDALDIASLCHPPLNPDMPALIAQVYSRAVASELKLVLMNQYPDQHQVALVDAAGTDVGVVSWLPLYEVDRQVCTPLTSLYVPELCAVSSFEGFQQTIAHLRSPDGCPWDREQTHKSLRTNLLEETYEVLDAIDEDDLAALREELGDLLLQVVLHTQIAVEDGEFYMSDVINAIDAKLKRRHPHVWEGLQVQGSDEVTSNWEAIKREERQENGKSERSMLDGVPAALPGLAQSVAYGNRVGRIGFELVNCKPMLRISRFESSLTDATSFASVVTELLERMTSDVEPDDTQICADALGELLFVIANWAEQHNIDPESAMRETNARFARRFKYIESQARNRRCLPSELDETLLAQLWNAIE